MTRDSEKAPANPSTRPINVIVISLTHDETQNIHALRAQGHTNTDLLRSPADRVTHHAIESDCREHERDAREDPEQDHVEAARSDRRAEQLLQRLHAPDHLVWIESFHFRACKRREL